MAVRQEQQHQPQAQQCQQPVNRGSCQTSRGEDQDQQQTGNHAGDYRDRSVEQSQGRYADRADMGGGMKGSTNDLLLKHHTVRTPLRIACQGRAPLLYVRPIVANGCRLDKPYMSQLCNSFAGVVTPTASRCRSCRDDNLDISGAPHQATTPHRAATNRSGPCIRQRARSPAATYLQGWQRAVLLLEGSVEGDVAGREVTAPDQRACLCGTELAVHTAVFPLDREWPGIADAGQGAEDRVPGDATMAG